MADVYTDRITDAVSLVDLCLTLNPGWSIEAAVAKICDLDGIFDPRDRRVVLHGVILRLVDSWTLPGLEWRAAA